MGVVRILGAVVLGAVALAAPAHADPPCAPGTPCAPAPQGCYQKLLYRICVNDDGGWRAEPSPALPIPGLPPP